jgi:hypothetical protein
VEIRSEIADGVFDQATIDLMVTAYDRIYGELSVVPRKYELANETIALAVMGLVREGERDVPRITRRVVQREQPAISCG